MVSELNCGIGTDYYQITRAFSIELEYINTVKNFIHNAFLSQQIAIREKHYVNSELPIGTS